MTALVPNVFWNTVVTDLYEDEIGVWKPKAKQVPTLEDEFSREYLNAGKHILDFLYGSKDWAIIARDPYSGKIINTDFFKPTN